MNGPGYEGNPEAAVGAMAGGGYGSGEGESARELSPSEARELVEGVERQQLKVDERQNRPHLSAARGQADW